MRLRINQTAFVYTHFGAVGKLAIAHLFQLQARTNHQTSNGCKASFPMEHQQGKPVNYTDIELRPSRLQASALTCWFILPTKKYFGKLYPKTSKCNVKNSREQQEQWVKIVFCSDPNLD